MAALGSGTVEIKSGYGLSTEHELRMLRKDIARLETALTASKRKAVAA